MASPQDTEITLGTGKLLSLFFGLVIICAVFFALGYSLGRKGDIGLPTAAAGAREPSAGTAKAAGNSPAPPPMTFYKSAEEKGTNTHLTPVPSRTDLDGNSASASNAAAATSPASAVTPEGISPSSSSYNVQVAAVTKQDDAEALVDALKKKQYPAFVAVNLATDKLFRVQIGPFTDIKDAEAMRSRLVNDGYNPILKK